MTADAETAAQGRAYLYAFLPSLVLMFPVNAMVSSLRGAGVVMPTMVLQTATIVLNAVLAPILIAGIGTGVPLGVAGAGWASSIAAILGTIALDLHVPARAEVLAPAHLDAGAEVRRLAAHRLHRPADLARIPAHVRDLRRASIG